ncbi:ABC-three component system protein [Pseudomonas sp. YH-1]|uniref:ABC-three component system protein n=1 Tax=Pseudomonas sp. YH-1 TaxID=3384787 RepID=UPI003F7F0CCA
MSMLEWVKKDGCPNLVLFVHGLKGGVDTWENCPGVTFPSMIACDPALSDRFDVACFSYFTTFTNTYGISKSLFARLFRSVNKIRNNLPINELGGLLKAEMDVHLSDYKGVYLVAHSMGGLVSKACILKQFEENETSPVSCFISLAVPHSGAKTANFGSIISSNVQLGDLSLMSNAIDQLGRAWLSLGKPPYSKYIYATYDLFVDKKSAVPVGCKAKDSLPVEEDHTSVCKPKDTNQTVYKAVVRYVLECESLLKPPLHVKKFVDEKQYDDHCFFLKLIVADVHQVITGHAKGYFFNAEEARKLFTSDRDREVLGFLYERIQSIYDQEYQYHIAHSTTADMFVEAVHRRIYDERDAYLKSALVELTDSHKKGMLHQLADKLDLSVVWDPSTTIEAIEKIREESK